MYARITDIRDGLMWTIDGLVWAVWRLFPLPYTFQPAEEKQIARDLHAALLRSFLGEGLLVSVAASSDPAGVVAGMIEGIEVESHPEWLNECEATLDLLEHYTLGERAYWLAVPLANTGTNRVRAPFEAGLASIKTALVLPRSGPSDQERSSRRAQAELIRKALPSVFNAREASHAEIAWLELHAQQRGLSLDTAVPTGMDESESASIATRLLSSRPLIDPCATADLPPKRPLTPIDVLQRRYVKITNTETEAVSYQSFGVVQSAPSAGVAFPGGEWLGRLDESGLEIDWALRITVRSRDEAMAKNLRAKTRLDDQAFQRDGENTAGTGGQLELSAYDLAEYQNILQANATEVEVDYTTILAVGASTADEVKDIGRELKNRFKRMEFKLTFDPSAQEELWWAMMPGAPTTKVVREYGQIQPAYNVAAAMPIVTCSLGDPRGTLLGLETSSGRPSAVLLDVSGSAASLEVSPAIAVAGELGAGKSVCMKKIARDGVDRFGATMTAIDRTEMGEWAFAAGDIDGAMIVDISDHAQYSLDPLRCLDPDDAATVTEALLKTLFNIDTWGDLDMVMGEILTADYLHTHGLHSLNAVRKHLHSRDDVAAQGLASRFDIMAARGVGRILFDESLPPVDLDAPALVFLTARTQLPSNEEVLHDHLYRRLPVEKMLGRAVFALIMALVRRRCFRNRERLDILAIDEAHAITMSQAGTDELRLFVRDGRKHLAALVIGSHDPFEDFGDDVLRGLIKCRILLRHTDETLAERGVRWVLALKPGVPAPEEFVELIAKDTSPVIDGRIPYERRGEALMRDYEGRIGRLKILLPAQPVRAERITTTPGAVEEKAK